MAKQKKQSNDVAVDTSAAKPMYTITADAVQGLEKEYNAILQNPDAEYIRLYGWIGKGNIDDTLKGILKELVKIRMGGNNV